MDSYLVAVPASAPAKAKDRRAVLGSVRGGRFHGDLSLLRQGLEVAIGFGVTSLEGLVGTAELLENCVYARGSLVQTPEGVAFTLLNPPLRMGAFDGVAVRWNGVPVPPGMASLRSADAESARHLDGVDREHPVTLPVGIRTVFELRGVAAAPGEQRVRLDLHSVAIPPRVWFEFSDTLRRAGEAP